MPTEGLSSISAGDLLALSALVATVLFGVWRMTESVRRDLRAELLENRRESTREHQELEQKLTASFDGLDARIRRSVTALLE